MTSISSGDGPRYFGLYPAIVTNVLDPEDLWRIEVRFPWLGKQGSEAVRAWATLLSPYAGAGQGFMVLPDVETQVVVGFEAGDLRRPYIVGSAWNGKDFQPVAAKKENTKRLIRTRSGSVIAFDDTDDKSKIVIWMPSGHSLVLDDEANQVTLKHSQGDVSLVLSGESLTLNAEGKTVELNAATFNVNAQTVNFANLIQCQTGIHQAAVTSPLYTPGAGNVW